MEFVIWVGLFGLIIGSFLNVVIHRLPIMMQREWEAEFSQIPDTKPRFDLFKPNSHCPHCHHEITFKENIPILSYIFLRGRCSQCQEAISPRYPLVEITCCLLSALLAWHFGWTWSLGFALLFTWGLLSASMIDIDHQLLPDWIIIPLLWVGLLASLLGIFTNPQDAIIGAVAGYMSLWSFAKIYQLITGKEGMGHGDMKLFALCGAWMGYHMLPFILVASSFTGALIGIAIMIIRRGDRHMALPFGPYLSVAGFIALLWGEPILSHYLQLFAL